MGKMTKDERQYKRKKYSFLLKYQIGSATPAAKVTNVQNISAGGLAFLTKDELHIGDRVALSILIPSFEKPVEVEGSVVRVEKNKARNAGFVVAIQYTKLQGENLKAMQDFDKMLQKEHRGKGKKTPLFVDLSKMIFGK